MKTNSVRKLTISALLIGMGVLIPMIMPKIVIPPASFTLASHVPLFIAMFFSPGVAVAVALGTTFGFFLTTPVIIALRALSHLVFALIGAWYLQKKPGIVLKDGQFTLMNWRFQGFKLIDRRDPLDHRNASGECVLLHWEYAGNILCRRLLLYRIHLDGDRWLDP